MTFMKTLITLLISCCLCMTAEAGVGKFVANAGAAAVGTAAGVTIAHALTNDKKDVESTAPAADSSVQESENPPQIGMYYCDMNGFSSAVDRCTRRLKEACPGCSMKLLSIDERHVPTIATFQIIYPEDKK